LWFADFARTQLSQLVRVLSNAYGDFTHQRAAFLGRKVPPDLVVGPSRVFHGEVHRLVVGVDHSCERRPRRRLEDLEGIGSQRLDKGPTDERTPDRTIRQDRVGHARVGVVMRVCCGHSFPFCRKGLRDLFTGTTDATCRRAAQCTVRRNDETMSAPEPFSPRDETRYGPRRRGQGGAWVRGAGRSFGAGYRPLRGERGQVDRSGGLLAPPDRAVAESSGEREEARRNAKSE